MSFVELGSRPFVLGHLSVCKENLYFFGFVLL